VLAPSTTTTVVALAYVHVAEVPVLGIAPTFAVHTNPAMKLVPVTVTVLPTYADKGAIEAAMAVAIIFNVVPDTAAETPEFVNVTCTDDAVPGRALEGVPDPITTTTCVPLEHEHDAAAVLVVGTLLPTRAVHAKPEIKLAPVTVIVLPAYADKGAIEAAMAVATNLRVVPDTTAETPEFVNVTCTDDAVPGRALEGVPDPITTTTCVPLEHEHEKVAVLVVGTLLPTLAVHTNPSMKLAPVTVMVLPTYADAGAIEVAVGAATMISVVPATVAETPEFVNVTSTDDAPAAVPAPITTTTVVALAYVHVAEVPELGVAPTLAEQALMKFVPVTVMVLPMYAEEGAMELAEGLKITPDATPTDATVSASVCTVMPVALPAVAAPIVRPDSVMVNGVVAAMPTTAVVMMMELPEMADVAVMLLTDVLPATLAAGLAAPEKNPAGYISVIIPLVESAAWVVNTSVTETSALAATRSPAAMVNVTAVV